MKLITLLKSLRPHEHHEFEKFLQSPFFKASDMYLRFFREIRKRSSTFDLDKNDMQDAYRRCFGKKSLNDTKWHNLTSGLGKQIEQFLVFQTIASPDSRADDNLLYNQLLVKALDARNMGAVLRAEAERVITGTLNRNGLEPDDYLALQQVYRHVYFNPDTQKFGMQSEFLQSAGTYLDLFYCIEQLRFAAEMKARENILGVVHRQPLLDAVLEYSNAGFVSEKYPLWAMYRDLVIYYRQEGGENGFEQLTTRFKEQFNCFSKNDRVSLSRHLVNIGIGLLAQDNDVEKTLFDLYKLLKDNEILLDDNRITYISFINIVNLAATQGQLVWGRNFIDAFQQNLEDDKREPTVNLAKATICYYASHAESAEAFLSHETTQVPPFDILNMGLYLKIIFDKYWIHDTDYEYLLVRIRGFKQFIRRKNMAQQKKDAYINWLNFLRKAAAAKFKNAGRVSPGMQAILIRHLGKTRPLAFKKWTAGRLNIPPFTAE